MYVLFWRASANKQIIIINRPITVHACHIWSIGLL